MFLSPATHPARLSGFLDPLKCNLAFDAAGSKLYTEDAVICESKIAPLSMPRGTGAFGDSPEIETEKCNRTDIDLFYHGIKEDFENG